METLKMLTEQDINRSLKMIAVLERNAAEKLPELRQRRYDLHWKYLAALDEEIAELEQAGAVARENLKAAILETYGDGQTPFKHGLIQLKTLSKKVYDKAAALLQVRNLGLENLFRVKYELEVRPFEKALDAGEIEFTWELEETKSVAIPSDLSVLVSE
jgi:hypothetical protein